MRYLRSARAWLVVAVFALLAATFLAPFPANAWIVGGPSQCKEWSTPLHLEICVNFDYGIQTDGDGIQWRTIEILVIDGCNQLERDDDLGLITGIKTFTTARAFPHWIVEQRSLNPQQVCGAEKTVAIDGEDTGWTYAQLNLHVRVDNWDDKDPIYTAKLVRP